MDGVGSGQHGEDRLLHLFFRDQAEGILVDVGAADGYMNSNSIGLLKRPGWSGVLVEPEPSHFRALSERYRERDGVVCLPCAVGDGPVWQTFFCGGQVSTFDLDVKKAAEDVHKIEYTTAKVEVYALTALLDDLRMADIDFLSIDAEGRNYDVWMTLDRSKHAPRLVCIEGKGYRMDGYIQLCRCGCNTFYVREDQCLDL